MPDDATLRPCPVNASIHKIDVCVEIPALTPPSAIYRRILEELLPKHV